MLLGAGYAVGPALGAHRRSRTGRVRAGPSAASLARVAQGLSTNDALHEWAVLVDVPAAGRLVSVLALDRETTDLGGLVVGGSGRDATRGASLLIEIVERRNQQVWIPVTIAALVPGAILLAIPFLAAMQLFARPDSARPNSNREHQ